jgi:hypothetical protein
MTVRHAFITGLAALHLVLVACGAAKVTLMPPGSTAWKWLRLYGEASGADNQYGFFAPVVGFQLRTLFTLTDKDGATWEDTHDHGATAESNLRFGGMTDAAFGEEEFDKRQVHSWAAYMFGRHPTAVSVHVAIQYYHLPSMAEYRMGARPKWVTSYETTYTRASVEESADVVGEPTTPGSPPGDADSKSP